MKRKVYFCLMAVLLPLHSCTDDILQDNRTVEYFHAKADCMFLPDSVSLNDTTEVSFCGYLGPDLCYTVSHFEVNQIKDGITIKIVGKHLLRTACLQAISGICETYKHHMTESGYFKFKVINPGNNYLIDSVLVY